MYFERILRYAEITGTDMIKNQAMDGIYKGGYVSEKKYVEPRSTCRFIKNLLALYITEGNIYYKNPEILRRVKSALEFVHSYQGPTGLFDLLDCNFASAPDTGFLLRELIPAYKLTMMDSDLADMTDDMKGIIIRALDGIVGGGFHTPNHRWVISGALLTGYGIFGDEKYKKRAQEYLFEGIDCTVDGEYAERSAAIYNVVSNEDMLTIARELGDDSYNEYARRNLKMMMSYIDPDGAIFTNNSTRQDRGDRVLPTHYFHHYLQLGLMDNNKEFLAFANYIWDLSVNNAAPAPDMLTTMILNPELNCVNNERFPNGNPDYHNFFKDSRIVRDKTGNFSYSIIENSSSFLYFQAGSLVMSAKIGGCICQHKAFIGTELTKTETGYQMVSKMDGWYYLPFTEKPATTDWWKMPNKDRDLLLGPDAYFTVNIDKKEDGVDVTMKIDGVDRMPIRIEFAFDESDSIETDGLIMPATKGNFITVKDGDVVVKKGYDAIKLSKAFYVHNFIEGKSGSEKRDPNLFQVYFTDQTPCEHTISIRTV